MNYYQPREKIKDGKPSGLWHYTVRNDDWIRPVGYCAQDCPGHEDREGAYAHWKEYLLDTADYERQSSNWQGCEVCDTPTKNIVRMGPGLFSSHALCDEHKNREELNKLVHAGDLVSSV